MASVKSFTRFNVLASVFAEASKFVSLVKVSNSVLEFGLKIIARVSSSRSCNFCFIVVEIN